MSNHIADANKMVGEDHIRDATKMVSDTPRTDEAVWQIEGGEMVCPKFCRQLERELNAANQRIQSLIEERDRANRLADWKWNLRGEFESLLGTDNIEKGIKAVKEMKQRIKRLEEAGDAMAEWLENPRNLGADACLSHAWREAKQAKP